MSPSCRRASDHLHVLVEQTTLLYKEGPEFLSRHCGQQPATSPELFHLRVGETTRNLPPAEWADEVHS
jgi:hypothetical protein